MNSLDSGFWILESSSYCRVHTSRALCRSWRPEESKCQQPRKRQDLSWTWRHIIPSPEDSPSPQSLLYSSLYR